LTESFETTLEQARAAFAEKNASESEALYAKLVRLRAPSDEIALECLERLLFLKKMQNKAAEAAPVLTRLIEICESLEGNNGEKVVHWKNELINVYRLLNRYDDAMFIQSSLPGFELAQEQEEMIEIYAHKALASGIEDLIEPEPEEKLLAEENDPEKFLKKTAPEPSLERGLRTIDKRVLQVKTKIKEHWNDIISGYSILATIVVLICFLYFLYAPALEANIAFQGAKPMHSASKRSSLRFLSSKQIELIDGNKNHQINYWRVDNPILLWGSSLASGLLRRELWMLDRGKSIVDEHGTAYYAESAEETSIVEMINFTADSMQHYFFAHKNYPEKLEDMPDVKFSYYNAYTGRKDKPLLRTAVLEDSRQTADQILKIVLKDLSSGGKFPFEPALYPGCIDACLYYVRGKDRATSLAAVHGCDQDGKLITTDGVKRTYLALNQSGSEVHLQASEPVVGRNIFGIFNNLEFRPPFLCLLAQNVTFLPLDTLRYRAIIIYFLLTTYYWFLFSQYNTSCLGRKLTCIFGLTSLACTIGAILNAFLP
jgi:hypothetical protein